MSISCSEAGMSAAGKGPTANDWTVMPAICSSCAMLWSKVACAARELCFSLIKLGLYPVHICACTFTLLQPSLGGTQ